MLASVRLEEFAQRGHGLESGVYVVSEEWGKLGGGGGGGRTKQSHMFQLWWESMTETGVH